MFEKDVKALKVAAENANLFQYSKHWNYGKDPHKTGRTGTRKALPRACSQLIRTHLQNWIPAQCKLQFCTMSRGQNCCYPYSNYSFSKPLNLVSLVQRRYGLTLLRTENQSKITKATINHIIPEAALKTKLQIVVNDVHVNQFYIKRVKQDRLAKSMDIAQNDYRMSYAPELVVESTGTAGHILISFACRGACLGLGFCDLVKWNSSATQHNSTSMPGNIDISRSDPIHSVIHICDAFELISNISIAFGVVNVVNATKINKIQIKLIDDDGPSTLYEVNHQNQSDRKQPEEEHPSSMYMPFIGDIGRALFCDRDSKHRHNGLSANGNGNGNGVELANHDHAFYGWSHRSTSPVASDSTVSSNDAQTAQTQPPVKKRRLTGY